MKKLFVIAAFATVLAVSCKKIEHNIPTEGTLSLASLELCYDSELETKAVAAASGNYSIFILGADGSEVMKTTYSAVKENGGNITLTAGSYTLEARSIEDAVPASAFEQPVYGASADFSIAAGETTTVGSLTCTLLQVKVSVSYDEAFLAMVTGPGKTSVTVDPTAPLEYALSYNDGNVSYDQAAGYFAVNNGENTTMNIVFSGKIEGKTQKMVANLTGIAPKQWRQIRFIKKVDAQGSASFAIEINGYVDDEELVVPLEVASESPIGVDPDAPVGDGGISLEFAEGCPYTDLENIVVPANSTPMDLRLVVNVPNGVKKFEVDMASTSDAFIAAVALAGGTKLDLVNPAPEQDIVFQIVPFPHGADLQGKTSLLFDLSAAQEPINAFPGTHTFTMNIVDAKGCRNSVPVKLIVNAQ